MSDYSEPTANLSDDDFLNSLSEVSTQTAEPVEEPADDVEPEESETVVESDADDDEDEADESAESESDDADEDADADDEDGDNTDVDAESDDPADQDPAAIDFEGEYNKLLAPFKASGREMQVKSVDEAIQLMQMGADYQKKMQSIKPGLKTLKLLQNHDLLEPGKVSLMIDAAKGDKAALTQLMKDSGIDPMSLDVEADAQYNPTEYTVRDEELAFDDVVDRIKDTPTYREAITLVGKTWDDSSREIVANNPHLLEVINDQIASGVYAEVSKEVDRQRLLGRLNNLSDIAAYRAVGEQMDSDGRLAHLYDNPAPAPSQSAPQRKVVTKPAPSAKAGKKKRAASPQRVPVKAGEDLSDLLNLSDEAFTKKFG